MNFCTDIAEIVARRDVADLAELGARIALDVSAIERDLLLKNWELKMAEAAAINDGRCEGRNAEARAALLVGATAVEARNVMLTEQNLVMAKAKLEAVRWAKQLLVAQLGGRHDE